jgi:hypothetical protein
VHISRIIEQLRATGVTITDEDIALVSPLAYAHVIPNGTYFLIALGRKHGWGKTEGTDMTHVM